MKKNEVGQEGDMEKNQKVMRTVMEKIQGKQEEAG